MTRNEKLTDMIRKSGVYVTYYDVPCPVCGEIKTLAIYPDEDTEERRKDKLDILLRCLKEYHDNPEP